MNKRELQKAFKELGIPKEDYQSLAREEMQALYGLFCMAEMFIALNQMVRIAPLLQRLTGVLQGKEPESGEK